MNAESCGSCLEKDCPKTRDGPARKCTPLEFDKERDGIDDSAYFTGRRSKIVLMDELGNTKVRTV